MCDNVLPIAKHIKFPLRGLALAMSGSTWVIQPLPQDAQVAPAMVLSETDPSFRGKAVFGGPTTRISCEDIECTDGVGSRRQLRTT